MQLSVCWVWTTACAAKYRPPVSPSFFAFAFTCRQFLYNMEPIFLHYSNHFQIRSQSCHIVLINIPCDLKLWNWPCKAKFNNLNESVIITIYRWKCHRALICHASILYKPASIKVKHFIIIFFSWYSLKQALGLNVFHLQCISLFHCKTVNVMHKLCNSFLWPGYRTEWIKQSGRFVSKKWKVSIVFCLNDLCFQIVLPEWKNQ